RENQPLKLAIDGSGVSLHDHQVVFGSNRAETIEGAGAADFLYGMGGDDTIKGHGGHDYIEGNAGNDTLEGGSGHDTLLGGTGTDTLVGDAGTDRLLGGLGADIYSFSGAWGVDTIEDTDGLGRIEVEGIGEITGAGALKLVDGVWQSPDKQLTYMLDDSSNTLTIHFGGRADAIVIKGWTPAKSLGITLTDTRTYPSTSNTLLGDYKKLVVNGSYERDASGNYTSDGPQANAADLIKGSVDADYISGLGGNDGLAGGFGNDFLDGGAGDDVLLGGPGADLVMGGAGNDFVLGAGWMFTHNVTSVSQAPLPSAGVELSRGFSWVTYATGFSSNGLGNPFYLNGIETEVVADEGNVLDGGSGSDYLFGGDHGDVITGGADNDLAFGLAGDDFISGGAGNDELIGDGTFTGGFFTTIAASQHGNDVLVGGAGHDVLVGGGGADDLFGGTGSDWLFGDNRYGEHPEQDGADYLDGGAGDDWLEGGGGDDVLIGGEGRDIMYGGAGNDLLISDGSDSLNGGTGNDTYLIRSLSGSQAEVTPGAAGLESAEMAASQAGPSALEGTPVEVSRIDDTEGLNVLAFDGAASGSTALFVEGGRTFAAAGAGHLVELGPLLSLASMALQGDEDAAGLTLQAVVEADNPYGLVRSRRWVAGQGAVDTKDISSAQQLTGSMRAELIEGGSAADTIVADAGADV
ncbi:MAG: calcium-binding protein, partial [Rubrivivax sp.]|nr:calcium-binding protein [Rubrivivax sp.]